MPIRLAGKKYPCKVARKCWADQRRIEPYITKGGPFKPYAPPNIPAMNPHINKPTQLSDSNFIDRPHNEYNENPMITVARQIFTNCSSADTSNDKPKGIPKNVKNTNHPALRTCIFFQSCTIIIAATVIDTKTETGTAISKGRYNAKRGTAMSDSPNPKPDRIRVAKKITNTVYMLRKSMTE